MMKSQWETVQTKASKKKKQQQQQQQQQRRQPQRKAINGYFNDAFPPLNERQVHQFLSTFKTKQCTKQNQYEKNNNDNYYDDKIGHDPRLCEYFHSDKDRRRNPYETCYTIDECLNNVEKMYHPTIFRTNECKSITNNNNNTKCIFGKICAHAHSSEHLRDQHLAMDQYENFVENKQLQQLSKNRPERSSLTAYVSSATACTTFLEISSQSYQVECQSRWEQYHIQPSEATLQLNEMEWWILHRSAVLYKKMEDIAFKAGLCCVQRDVRDGKFYYLHVRGMDAKLVRDDLRAMLRDGGNISIHHQDRQQGNHRRRRTTEYFCIEERQYPERVIGKIKEEYRKVGVSMFVSSDDVRLYFIDEESMIRVVAVGSEQKQTNLLRDVFDKITFWTKREGYDSFFTCQCCFEQRNPDEGILCSQNHFTCSVDGCFGLSVKSQIFHIRSRDTWVVCPQCDQPYDIKDVAAHVPSSVLQDVLQAVIDKLVEKERATIQQEFDRQLEEKVNELIAEYANAPGDGPLKLKAKQEAKNIRNTILNLSCPHCGKAYFDFTGCMALSCASCNKSFCGYCHAKCATSSGAHNHVRECLMNVSRNGNYYANEQEISNAQRMYRTRELKKYIRQFKKGQQNAIIIELKKDLEDLDIDPAGLFEVGNELLPADLVDR